MLSNVTIIAITFLPLFLSVAIFGVCLLVHSKRIRMQNSPEANVDYTPKAKVRGLTKSAAFSLLLFGLVRTTDTILLIVATVTKTTNSSLLIATAILEFLGSTLLARIFNEYALFDEMELHLAGQKAEERKDAASRGLDLLLLAVLILFIIGASYHSSPWAQKVLKAGALLLLITMLGCGIAYAQRVRAGHISWVYAIAYVLLIIRISYSVAAAFDQNISTFTGRAPWEYVVFPSFLPEILFCAVICYIQCDAIRQWHSKEVGRRYGPEQGYDQENLGKMRDESV